MTAGNRMGSFWPAHDQLRIDLAPSNTYDEMLRAQARIKDWLTSRGEYSREAVREMVEMVVGGA